MELEEVKEINLSNGLKNDIEIPNDVTYEMQNKFLESTLGRVVNTGIDIGLRAVLPNVIENQVIDVKDIIIKSGFKEGIDAAVKSAIELGKSAMGIVTGKFESISQAHTAVRKGGILDAISSTIDKVLKNATKNELISKNTSNFIKRGKNLIVNTVSDKIEESFMKQLEATEKVGKYISNWNEYYQKKDLTGMEREYKKIKTQLKELMPIEKTLKDARKIENIQTLIKNKNGDINLSEEELELASKLA